MSNQTFIPMIGVDMLHYAKVLADTVNGYEAEKPIKVMGVTEAGFNMNTQNSTFYADNGPYCTAVGLGEFEGAIACADLPPSMRADLYGFEYDSSTGEMSAGDINPPDIAVQYRIQKANGAYRYVTLYKMKAVPKAESFKTAGGSVNFETNGFAMKGAKRLSDGKLYRILDDDSPNLPAGVTPKIIEDNWFADVNWTIGA